ncbi:MAG: ABC transporter permease [Candidatus Hodarchaeales archaeon]|jgi:putative ABC transport system permease protein
MTQLRFLLRWSFRDLRERKFQVIALSLIIGLGTGAYVGLSSTTPWRQYAFDESNNNLNMFDLKMELAFGSWVNQTDLSSTLKNIPHASWIEALELRVVFPVSVNTSTENQTILVNGRIIGINVTSGSQGLKVNGIEVMDGRDILSTETNASVCIVEYNFAQYYDIQTENQNIILPGGINLSCIGTGLSPEYFMVIEGNAVKAESVFSALFVPMETAQRILQYQVGLPIGHVNEALFLISSEADLNVLQDEITTAFNLDFPTIDVDFTKKDEYPSYRIQKEDIPNDQQMYFIISFLILLAAAFGTFNLVSRVINSHRRQIGINMALGVPPRQLAIRYLIFSFEIALGGVICGLLLSQFLGERLGSVLTDVIPFPVWKEWLVVDLFMQGTILGILIPFSATVIPIWRATRVRPIQAIQTGYTLSTGKGAAPLLERIRFPGSIFIQLPFRNFARNPRRTFSTIMGVALSLSVLIAILALLDGGTYLLDREQALMEGNSPNRLHVGLNDFYNISSETVRNMTQNPKVEKAVPAIEIPGTVFGAKESFSLSIHFFDLGNEIWTPDLGEKEIGTPSSNPGIIISKKTARELDVDVGETLILEHLYRESSYQYSILNTTVEIIGVYGSQVRFWAFMDLADNNILNCTGLINSLILLPKPGVTIESIQSDLFEIGGYSGVQTIIRLVETYEELIELFTSILTVIQYAVMALALLMAFNTATINFDERLREFATMGAFGTPIRTSIWMLMVESIIIGVFGTLLGFYPLGFIVMEIFQIQIRTSMPEVSIAASLFFDSVAIIIFIGVVLVAFTPLLSIRKLTKMDLPSALRVIE